MTTTPQTSHRIDHSIWPAIFSEDPHALRRFLSDLGFKEGIVVPAQGSTQTDGDIAHSELLWPEGGRIMVASATHDHSASHRAILYVVTDHPDEVHARAVDMGAEIHRAPSEQDGYESREFSLRDPDGNEWSFGTYGG